MDKERMSESSEAPKRGTSRRSFLKKAGAAAAGGVAVAAGADRLFNLSDRVRRALPLDEAGIPGRELNRAYVAPVEAELGGKILRLDTANIASPDFGQLSWVPDTATSFIVNPDGEMEVYVSAGTDGVVLTGRSLFDLGEPRRFMVPSRTMTERGYEGYKAPGAVFEGRDPSERVAVYHRENWRNPSNHFPFAAEIGIAISNDKGQNWRDIGSILTGKQITNETNDAIGVGQPSVYVEPGDNAHAYLFYTNWDQGSARICMARAPFTDIDNPNAWKTYANGDFQGDPRNSREATPVLIAESGGAAALAHVTWNKAIGQYLMVFERGYEDTQTAGFYVATSPDLTNWSKQQKIGAMDPPLSERDDTTPWNSYPTLLSPEEGNQFVTNNEGYLLVSKTTGWDPHTAALIPFTIT